MRLAQLAVCAALAAFPQGSQSPPRQAAAPVLVREQQTVLVRGRPEIWRLEWHGAPTPYCEAADPGSGTCPCDGFAYGEAGDLWLVRVSGGKEIDRLHLSPFFADPGLGTSGKAILQRWAIDYYREPDLADRPAFARAVTRWPVVKVMRLADYDHDGAATEFYVQTAALACGAAARYGMVLGISARNPRLHAFGTASRPDRPLYLAPSAWKALRQASRPPVHVVDLPCGDHGADRQRELLLRWSAAGIDGTVLEYACPLDGSSRRLLSRKPLAALADSL